ncbi:MAG: hypothetical protein AAGE80_05400 [Pseudomonadota bacterium]
MSDVTSQIDGDEDNHFLGEDVNDVASTMAQVAKDLNVDLDAVDESGDDDNLYSTFQDPEPNETVTERDGRNLALDAKNKPKAETPADEAKPDEKDAKPDEAKPEAKPEEQKAEEDASKKDEPRSYDDIVSGLSDADKTVLADRTRNADEVMTLFTGHEDQLERFGYSPDGKGAKDAIARMIQLNDIANRDTAGYVAWLTGELGRDPKELIGEIAKNLRINVDFPEAKVEVEEDDEFMDPELKAAKARNRELEAQIAAATQAQPAKHGPDNPREIFLNGVNQIKNEIGADGKPLRPMFERLMPLMIERGQAYQAQNGGQPVAPEMFKQFYDEAVAEMRELMGAPEPAPAQDPDPAPKEDAKAQADPIAKADRASSIVTGPGQGASSPQITPAETTGDAATDIRNLISQISSR